MSLNANALANLLYDYAFQLDGVSVADVTVAPANQQRWIALAITQAFQECHKINPALWTRRPGITLSAPISGTATVTFGSTAITLGTLTVPNGGCTVRFASGIDNEIEVTPTGYALRRPHDGATGLQGANLWHDCWIAADGTSYENVLGDVLANERVIAVARTLNEVELCRQQFPWWDYGLGGINTRLRYAGRVLAVILEPWASPYTNQIQTRLRFTPMPACQTVIDANLQAAAQVVTIDDIIAEAGAAVLLQTPAELDESIILPIALKKYARAPFFRTESSRKGIDEDYTMAMQRVEGFRGHQEARAGCYAQGW